MINEAENYNWWQFEQKSHREIKAIFRQESSLRPWCNYFIADSPYYPGDLNSKCRIGFVPFDECLQDRMYYVDNSGLIERLIAGAIATQLHWDENFSSLLEGWQGVVKQSFFDYEKKISPNTLVALLAFTAKRYRNRGISDLLISKMIEQAKKKGYKYLLIPALPPTQFEKDKASLPMNELLALKTKDGEYYDYWARLHSRKGAEIIGVSDISHRFIYTSDDFQKFVSSTEMHESGEYLIKLDKDPIISSDNQNRWQLASYDEKRDLISFNWGCIWFKYKINY